MEFGDPFIKRVVCQVNFDHCLRFFSAGGNIASKLMKKFSVSEYRFSLDLSQPLCMLRSKPQKMWIMFSHEVARVIQNDPPDFDSFSEFADSCLHDILGELKVDTAQRVGVRTMSLSIPEPEDFGALKEKILGASMRNPMMEELQFHGDGPSDVALVFDFKADPKRGARLEIGPLLASEVARRYEEEECDCPNVSLLIDVDYFLQDNESKSRLVVQQTLRQADAYSKETVNKIMRLMKGAQ